jgi:BMFP domain-containing protein YqiC
MAQDYILRLIEQVGQMLAEISRLRKAEIPQRIRAICQQTIGLSLDLVKRSSPEMILKLLESGGGTQYARAVMLAELLLRDAELSAAAGKDREATISRAQAQVLPARSIDNLSADEQAAYRPKLEALTASLTALGSKTS